MTPAQRLAAGALAVVLGGLAVDKLLDLDGYVSALASLPLVEEGRAWEAATLFAGVEICAAGLLALVALAGRHARVAFEGGAALALAASIGYAILVVSAYYAEVDLPAGALFGTRVAVHVPPPALIAFVVALMSWSAWTLATAFLLPEEPRRRRRRRRLSPTTLVRRVG